METRKFQQIEFVFENCECVLVDVRAISYWWMHENGKNHSWDPHREQLLTALSVDDFAIQLKDDPQFYSYSDNQRRIYTKNGTLPEGETALKRIKTGTDLSQIYIEDTCYNLPWKRVETPTDFLPIVDNGKLKIKVDEKGIHINAKEREDISTT